MSVSGSVVVVSGEDHDQGDATKSGAACVYRTADGGDTWDHSTTLMLDAPETGDGFAGAFRSDSNPETGVGTRTVSTDGSVAVAGAYYRGPKNAGGGYVFRV